MSTPTDREILEHLAEAEWWTAKPLWLDDLTVMRPFGKRMADAVRLLQEAYDLVDLGGDAPTSDIGKWLERYNANPSDSTLK